MKVCFKCLEEKELTEFYKHKGMSDGHLGKCKSCTVIDSKKTTELSTSTPEGLEKERKRHREKYSRLGYKNKQKELDQSKLWTQTAKYKNLSRKFKTPKGIELHHWNYNNEFLEDVFLLKAKQHKIAHNFLLLDMEKLIFTDLDGNYLDTKTKHLSYILSKGIEVTL